MEGRGERNEGTVCVCGDEGGVMGSTAMCCHTGMDSRCAGGREFIDYKTSMITD